MSPVPAFGSCLRLGALLAILGVAAAGCSPTGVAIGAGAMAGSAALEERGFRQVVADEADELSISDRLAKYGFETFRRVNVEVWEGRAILTGIVPHQDDRVEAVRIAWQTDGIVEVVNEILVGEGPDLFDTTHDVTIAARLRAAITFDKDVRAVNYAIEAVAGTVHLIGIAESEAELARVKAHAREVPHVRRLVDHVLLKDGPERARLLKELAAEKERLDALEAEPSEETEGQDT